MPPRPRRIARAVVVGVLGATLSIGASGVSDASPRVGRPARPTRLTRVAQRKKPPPPPPLDGITIDYDYDGGGKPHRDRRWLGRAFVHAKAASLAAQTGQALPILVFIHGNNSEAIKYRWMGGGQEGDVRRIVSEMIEAGTIPPLILAAPSSVDPYTMTQATATWPAFDLDVFLDKTIEQLGTAAVVDRGRVIVAGHSGGGCNIKGGLNTAAHAKGTPVLAVLSIDTCMMLDLAKDLAHVRPTTNVIVSWQTMSWDRDFSGFKLVFTREVKKAPPMPGVLRELDYVQPTVPSAHDALVGITLRHWLPRLLPTGVSSVRPMADAGVDAALASDGG